MELSFSPADLEFRAEVREWLRTHVPTTPLPSLETEEGFAAHRRWERTLYETGLSVVAWPEEFGGRDASLVQWLLFEEEYYAAGAPGRVGQNGIFLLAPTLFEHGTAEQRHRFLPRMADGTDVWAQAWSEPEAGSDLAGIRSRAHRVDGGWRLSGQKTWSSRAAFADRAFGLFRTDPEAERHRGLTYFLFPLDAEGVTVRPIGRLDGKPAFAEIFLDEVFVPDADVLGEVGNGWRVAMSTASSERGLSLRSPGRFLAAARRLVESWRPRPESTARDGVVDAWIGAQAYRLATFETVSRILDGDSVGPEASLNKVYWSQLDIALHETALELLGPSAELTPNAPEAPEAGAWLDGYLFSLAGPIYAGTNEIQRNVIAERVLGLPRGSR
ncbi:alkylation response protein AidB-like acyl-CoA dehydrogenase [Halopolyspora algeriensis]|uniref:Alkylation response protein AidB-like acyl-CoA dehydrogenase n=1 Tax=Halopolyspora algeriensis TaxID=1500506 RepID=A0A368VUV7_9ACTN|nr:acyl-CoA dehydrogenase family protein [Halopolyspora algeriensis]RCW44448.1 alkylation response protein AidB-like acyl-CoA dehydrogenase [Halopolyspora algeriensis]TQM55809.1 alkylation response protein AidB-like acyl-CoA dehydrogenase [Halopolyspora algeriensis]